MLVTRGVPAPVRDHLAGRCRLEVWEGEGVMPRAELLDRVAGKAGMVAMLTDRVDGELLDRAGPGLRVVANYAVGHDNLDLEACTARGVLATNTPAVVTEATADLAVKLAADGTPDDEAAARLLSLRGADRVALEQAARRTAGNPETSRALGLLGRVAVLRALL